MSGTRVAGSHMTVIAIDGPVGAGKSSVARGVAARLGLEVLETGAMYRAVAVAVADRTAHPDHTNPTDATGATGEESPGEVAARLVADLEIDVRAGERVTLDGRDVTDRLRRPDIARTVSLVAAHPTVRADLVRRQREWVAARGGAVVEGRDIASVVFPDADVKIFLTASEDERARRRGDERPSDVARRDRLDSSRTASPLLVAEGAIVIDSTRRSVDDIVDEIVGYL